MVSFFSNFLVWAQNHLSTFSLKCFFCRYHLWEKIDMLLHFFKTERISYHIYEFFALNEKKQNILKNNCKNLIYTV